MSGRYTIVVWFRNDLRVRDNAILAHSVLKKKNARVIPFFCFDPTYSKTTSSASLRFQRQCINSLDQQLRERYGCPLNIFNDKTERVIGAIAAKSKEEGGDGMVLCSQEVCFEELKTEQRVQEALQRHGGEGWSLNRVWNYSLYHVDDVPFDMRNGELVEGFSSMRKAIENARVDIRAPLPPPKRLQRISSAMQEWITSLPGYQKAPLSLPADEVGGGDASLRFVGGEEEALLRLEKFCQDGLETYKDTRNESIGWNYSSKLSPWLARGCVSPRQVAARIRSFEDTHGGETVHTYWVIFELMWRDYMRWYGWKHGNKIFKETGTLGRLPNGLQWCSDASSRLNAWKNGVTGVPWVDGHMRELLATGFMSNRGRQNVASFLIHEMNVDWREGARHFESHLIDHDVTANWCNWLHAAGVAKGSRVNRFNMDKQAKQYDPLGRHAKLWIPELSDVPGGRVHSLADPKARKGASRMCPLYPHPVISPPPWASHNGGSRGGRGRKQRRKSKGRPHQGRSHVFHTS